MSYSFTVTGKTKADAKQAAVEALRKNTAQQSAHDADREQVASAINSFADAMPEPGDGESLRIECYGHAGGEWAGSTMSKLRELNCTIKLSLVPTP